jgi:dipeptidyl aminopeptidase/acylaminoacyl peptidase
MSLHDHPEFLSGEIPLTIRPVQSFLARLRGSSFRLLSVIPLFSFLSSVQAQEHVTKELSIEKIMQDPARFIGTSPDDITWALDSRNIYFRWNPDREAVPSIYQYDMSPGKIIKVSDDIRKTLPQGRSSFNRAGTKAVYVHGGNLYLADLKEGKREVIISLTGDIGSPGFSADEKKIIFIYGSNLYSWCIESGQLKQYTNFIREDKQSNEKEFDSKEGKWLHEQQMKLISVLNDEKIIRDAERRDDSLQHLREIKPLYTGSGSVFNLQLSPGENYISYSVYTSNRKAQQTVIPEFITESGYTETFKSRSKVGGSAATIDLCIFDIKRDTVYGIHTDSLPGISDNPEYFKYYTGRDTKTDKKRKVFVTNHVWSGKGEKLLVDIYAEDNKDRWIALLDPGNGNLRVLDRQHDSAWISGPGIAEYFGGSVLGWLPDNKRIFFQSEASGYSHLYTLDLETGKKIQVTQGDYEVYDPVLSKDGKSWYFLANMAHPGVRHLYRLPVEGGGMIQLTAGDGGREYYLSPDEKWIALRYSSITQPWELYLIENKKDAIERRITHSQTLEFSNYPWNKPEVINFQARDGKPVYARLYRPEKTVAGSAAIIFVHGAGYLQNAHKWWSDYFHEFMFHTILVNKGYTVLDIDYRGSSGYGREWRTGIYRFMGGKDLDDQVDGAHFLVREYGIDSSRIGIYGGSYGGFITLMAMFTQPGTFRAGAALRSVTDWAHYNQPYTSNILNTPVDDSLAYVRSSPIYFAEGLEGNLLICHGMIDDNVHFQDVVRLSQRLIELGKDNWEMAVYPMESHTFTNPSSWTDEYKRIFKLFDESLKVRNP